MVLRLLRRSPRGESPPGGARRRSGAAGPGVQARYALLREEPENTLIVVDDFEIMGGDHALRPVIEGAGDVPGRE